ncbi:Hematopoietic lineage cell-specific protein [Wickerhamomyces ciferrii]|uniref:Hematopoietic lineage cell-specific protein n=1 Tax=Wickerhamomyces ciferrii (strain ATCC 14091 / BCRC 22168 / CBS 111 / JCM 3599 / NBRC 0793 / NRRL Y-1031 F-60-10) TaxID=1206466 RepID=K0KMC9_WICCF|nr:Hematopoietic lineage cell-specific protein [Wickerhamomyces ciferrii]CCH44141.1 Hematopoietic lineage cell-specific protein [Wickerhamomyces ciferrii]
MSNKTIKDTLEALSHMASILYRGLGYQQLTQKKDGNSIITEFSGDRRVIVLWVMNDDYAIIYNKDAQVHTVEVQQDWFLKGVKFPISPEELDEIALDEKKQFGKTFIGYAFSIIGEIPENLKSNASGSEELKLVNTKLIQGQQTFEKTGKLPTFTDKEVNLLLYKIVKPKLAGELLFPPELKDDSAEEKKRQQKAKKRAEQREKKQREKQLQEEQERKQEEERKLDKYPIYTPRPLSGFE